VTFDKRANELPKPAVQRVISAAQSARSPALQVELGGQAIEQAQQTGIGFATAVGIAAAMVILLISFGSVLAMGLPIATALLGLGAGIGLIGLGSQIIDMADFSSQLALMIGLGVGVDYALFIVTRYRENYRANGGDLAAAVEGAMDTAGRAVLFAGTTVVIALLGMFALGVNLLNGVAIAAALGVVLVLAASLTLLPALLGFAGRRIGEVGRARAARADNGPGFWARWVRAIQRRPAVAAVAATAIMLVLAAPALGLRLGATDAGNDPAGQTTRKAYDLIAQGFGKGFNGPLQLAVKLPKANAGPPRAAERIAARDSGRRLGRSAATQLRRRHGLDPGLPDIIATERSDDEPRHAPAHLGAPAGRAIHRDDGLRRRRDREPGRLRARALEQAAALHRRRDRAVGAAAAGRVPLLHDPAAGRGDEPALDRRRARRLPGHIRARLAEQPVRHPARAHRSVHSP